MLSRGESVLLANLLPLCCRASRRASNLRGSTEVRKRRFSNCCFKLLIFWRSSSSPMSTAFRFNIGRRETLPSEGPNEAINVGAGNTFEWPMRATGTNAVLHPNILVQMERTEMRRRYFFPRTFREVHCSFFVGAYRRRP